MSVSLSAIETALPLFGAAIITSYGDLKLMPFRDPLRDDARFDRSSPR